MKYELTKEKKEVLGITLYRIKALKDFGDVEKGDLGGWIEKESNLSQEGLCWVYDEAQVYGYAQISGNAKISDNALVFGNARIFGNASVYGNAYVFGNALVYGYAWVYGYAFISGEAHATKETINLIGLDYNVTISDNYMQIGCENHSFEYWLNINKEDILKMDGKKGIKFAKTHKKYLKKLIKTVKH